MIKGQNENYVENLSIKNNDQCRIPFDWNATLYEHPVSKCVHEVFQEQAALTPDAIAVDSAEGQLTFGELNQRSNQLARQLCKKGVKPNTFVGISMERSLDMIVGIYGILKAGAAYVPLDPAYPQDRLTYMVEAAKIHILLTQSALSPRYSQISHLDIICLDTDWKTISTENRDNFDSMATPSDLIYLIFTSGSTGQPKGAAVYHHNFMNLIFWFVTEFNITEKDRNLLVSSLSFDLTQKNLYAPLVRGGQLHLAPPGPYDPQKLARIIFEKSITLINCTPSFFYPMIEPPSDESFRRLSSMRIVFLGGEPISISRLRKWMNFPECHAEVANTYGPTECTDICGFYRMTKQNMDRYEFVPLGKPIHNVQLLIVKEEFILSTIGTPGELCVAGAGIGAGYINDPKMTAEKFVPNPFPDVNGATIYRTGDRARWLPDGTIEFLGRLDNQVKIRGFRIELHEIESVLNSLPVVKEAVVVVRKGPGGDESARLISYIMPIDGHDVNTVSIRNHLSEKLPDYMVPSAIYALPVFPLSPNGKVDRIALKNAPEPASNLKQQPFDSPQSVLERKIHQIWSVILGRPQIRMDENFFDAGGNSIQLAQVHVRLQKVANREFPITDLVVHPSIRAAAAYLSEDTKSDEKIKSIQNRAMRQRMALASRRRLRN